MEVYYYTTGARQPVRDYIEELPDDERAPIFAALLDIEERGLRGTTVMATSTGSCGS